MKRQIGLIMFVMSMMTALVTAGPAHGDQGTTGAQPQGVAMGKISETRATVEAIDQEKRIVTLRDERGNVRDFKFGPEAVNLPQVRVGDVVTMRYHESVAVEPIQPGSPSSSGEKTTITRAKPGEMPGGAVTRQLSTTATVKEIDREARTISLMRPDGKTVVIRVQDPATLDKVRAGDELMITYTEAEAISVTRAG